MFQQHLEQFRRASGDLGILDARGELGRIAVRILDSVGDCLQQALPIFRPNESVRHRAQLTEILLRAGFLAGDFLNRIILQNATARLVEFLGDGFAPRGNRDDNGRIILLRLAQFQSLPCIGRVGVVFRRVFQVRHFLADPIEPPEGFQIVSHLEIRVAQMGHVPEGVDQLLLAEGTAGPVGELAGLVDLALQDTLNEIVIGNRITEAERHGGDLRIEDRAGRVADQPVEDFDILTGGMKHFYPVVGGDQVQEGADVQIVRQGVDQAFHAGGGGLHEAEFRPICRLPVKLGVDADKVGFRELSAQVFQCRLLSNGSQGVVSHRALAYRIALTIARGSMPFALYFCWTVFPERISDARLSHPHLRGTSPVPCR